MSVVIVGKPNVGKSSLFNALIGKSKSLVLNIPGVTRDRVFGYMNMDGKEILVVDTGGFSDSNSLSEQINEQIQLAIDEAEVIVIVFDPTTPVTNYDTKLFLRAHRSGKPVIPVLNKADISRAEFLFEYHRFGEAVRVSSTHRRGIANLKERITSLLSETEPKEKYEARISIVGRSNVGKSSLLNAITGENRSIVSNSTGTTTDSVDSVFEFRSKKYLLVDTAGIRKLKVKGDIEKLSSLFAVFALEKSDIALLVIDATEGITSLDKKIAGMIEKKYKASIVALNKWDMVEDQVKFKEYSKRIKTELFSLQHSPIVSVSAKQQTNIPTLLKTIEEINRAYSTRIPTHTLNKDLHEIIKKYAPFSKDTKEIKLKYLTQVSTRPPHFILFTNKVDNIPENYKRYVRNSLYKLYGFTGCSIRLTFKKEEKHEP